MKQLNKIHVIHKNSHEMKQGILVDYAGEFEMFGKLSVGEQIRGTHIKFRNITDYDEHYINAIDERYDAEDAIFNSCIYKKKLYSSI